MKTNEQSRRQAAALRWVVRIFMILVTVIMIYPLLWNVYSSFKTNNEFLTNAFSLPKSLAWDNYARAIEKSNLLSKEPVWFYYLSDSIGGIITAIFIILISY